MKKILFVASLDSPHTIRWANGLQAHGYEVLVFSIREPLPGLSPDVKAIVRKGMSKWAYLTHGPVLVRAIKSERPDVVHVLFASGLGFLASLWLRKGSYMLSMLGADVFDFPRKPIQRWLLRRNLARAGALLSTSVVMLREARRYTARPIEVTPFGVDVKVFTPPAGRNADRPLRIGTARRLEPKYGVDTLIEAFALLRERLEDREVELHVAGVGPERAHLGALAERLGVADAVRFRGWLAEEEMVDFLRGLDVFCALSRLRSESFCVAVLEASACGVPVLASRIGGLPETVAEGETGFLVAPDSPPDAADRLADLCGDETLRHQLGERGRRFVVERYDWRMSLAKMESVYRAFVATRQAA